jgi:hypothetical protein
VSNKQDQLLRALSLSGSIVNVDIAVSPTARCSHDIHHVGSEKHHVKSTRAITSAESRIVGKAYF